MVYDKRMGSAGGIDFAFLDSGTGGIPYMLALKKKQPAARCVYLGDTAHFPYGEKTPEEVTDCAAIAIESIVRRWHPRAVVIACNTMSVTALDRLRERFPALPIVGTVPAIRLAARVSKNRRIGLLATNATVRHPYCQRLIADFASDCTVFSRGDPALVAFVEHSLFTATATEKRAAVLPAVQYFAAHDCDTIILGCTHFTHIAHEVAAAAGDAVTVIDSRDGVSNQALRVVHDERGGALAGDDVATANGAEADKCAVPHDNAAEANGGNAVARALAGNAVATADGAEAEKCAVLHDNAVETNIGNAAVRAQAGNAVAGVDGGAEANKCAVPHDNATEANDGTTPLPADMSFFVTACTAAQRAEYETLCKNLHIPYGGILL